MRGFDGVAFGLAALAVAVLAACSATATTGGVGSTQILPGIADSMQRDTGGGKAGVTVRILVPKSGPTAGPRFVSPATKSLQISISLKGKLVTVAGVNLTASNRNCKKNSSGLQCSQQLALAPAKYVASFSTYSGVLKKKKPTGKELSADQKLPLKVPSKGLSITIDNDLAGIPASVAFVPSSDSQLSGSQKSGYSISRCGFPQSAAVIGVDASGYEILGSGAPQVSISSSNTKALAVGTPDPSQPNSFGLTIPSPPPSGTVVTLAASAKPPATSGAKAASAKISVVFNSSYGCVTQYQPPSHGQIFGIVEGADGNLWFTEASVPSSSAANLFVGKMDPATGSMTEYAAGTYNVPNGQSLGVNIVSGAAASASSGELWFANWCCLGQITTNGSVSSLTPAAPEAVRAVSYGPGGLVYFLDCCGNIAAYDPSTEHWSGPWSVGFPVSSLTAGPDGNIWFAGASGAGKMTPGGVVTNVSTDEATAIANGSDGNLWFSGVSSGAAFIAKVTTAGAVTKYPAPIDANFLSPGLDGNLWFFGGDGASSGSYYSPNSMDEISTLGSVTSHLLPFNIKPCFSVEGLAFAGGRLWFAAEGANSSGTGFCDHIDSFQLN